MAKLLLVGATTVDVVAAMIAFASAGCSRNNPSESAARDRAAVVDAAPLASVAPTAAPAAREVTYTHDVRPLLEAHCQRCHVRGGIAPFALTTFDEARDVASAIVDETRARRMPPWGARETAECTPRFGWRNDERLSNDEIATLEAWVRQGVKEGSSASQPQRSVAGARLGETAVLTPRDGFVFPVGTREDVVRCFVLDPKLARPRYMTGSDFVPGNRSIVHHAIVFAIPPGAKTPHDVAYECPGGPNTAGASLVAAWAPGGVPSTLPPGVALPVDAGTKLVLQVHYHPHANATRVPDRTTFRMELSDEAPAWVMVPRLIGNFRHAATGGIGLLAGPSDPPTGPVFAIPVNAPRHTETMVFTVPSSLAGLPLPRMRILGVGAHMHLAGIDQKLTLKRGASVVGEPREECLLQEPSWAFDWQRIYMYDAPVESLPSVGPGDSLEVRCTYDNSLANVQLKRGLAAQGRRSPTEIRLGEGTLDEMCLAAVQLVMKR